MLRRPAALHHLSTLPDAPRTNSMRKYSQGKNAPQHLKTKEGRKLWCRCGKITKNTTVRPGTEHENAPDCTHRNPSSRALKKKQQDRNGYSQTYPSAHQAAKVSQLEPG